MKDVEDTVAKANESQLILMAIVGVVCGFIATAYVYWINSQVISPYQVTHELLMSLMPRIIMLSLSRLQVTDMTYKLYHPFILLPTVVVRGMVKADIDSAVLDANKSKVCTVIGTESTCSGFIHLTPLGALKTFVHPSQQFARVTSHRTRAA